MQRIFSIHQLEHGVWRCVRIASFHGRLPSQANRDEIRFLPNHLYLAHNTSEVKGRIAPLLATPRLGSLPNCQPLKLDDQMLE